MSDDAPIPHDLTDRLRRLEPQVDVSASRAVFERGRTAPAVPRWLMPAAAAVLIVGGIVGLLALRSGDDDVVPSADTDPAAEEREAVNVLTEGDGYETVLVAESRFGFGNAELVTSDEQLDALWDEWTPGPVRPGVDFSRAVAVVTTRPDDACPDALVRFERGPADDRPTEWTAVFEDLAEECEVPLLSWIYVVAIDRDALGAAATIVLPAQDIFDVPEQRLEYTAAGSTPSDPTDDESPTLADTGIVVDLPEVGSPTLHNLSIGLVWVVAHDDGTVSVLPATVDVFPVAEEDTGGANPQQRLVSVSSGGDAFLSSPFTWDDHGRTINGGRVNDLAGFVGRVEDDGVHVWTTDADRIEGAPEPLPDRVGTSPDRTQAELRRAVGEPMDPMTFFTLSSSGPIWRYFDATLVVEDGVGRICELPTDVPVPDQTGCDDAEIAIDTQVTSGDPDLTTWFHPPILAFQDPLRGFTTFVPLGGISSRNDAAFDEDAEAIVTDVRLECGPPGLVIRVDMEFFTAESAEFVVIDGDVELTSGNLTTTEPGESGIGLSLTNPPTPDAELRVSFGTTDLTLPLPDEVPDCTAEPWERLTTAITDDVEVPGVVLAADPVAWNDLAERMGVPTDRLDDESLALAVTAEWYPCTPDVRVYADSEPRTWVVEYGPGDEDECEAMAVAQTTVLAVPADLVGEQFVVRLATAGVEGGPRFAVDLASDVVTRL